MRKSQSLGYSAYQKTIEKRINKLRGRKRRCFWNDKKVLCVETGEIFINIILASKKINRHPSGITKVIKGNKKTAGGYHWQYC